MLTANGRNWLLEELIGSNVDELRCVTVNGSHATTTTLGFGYMHTVNALPQPSGTGTGLFIRVGIGTAEPSVGDINLEETMMDDVDVNDLVRCVDVYIGRPSDGASYYTAIMRNMSNRTIQLNEAGLFYWFGANRQQSFLLAREKISPSVTLNPGDPFICTIPYNFYPAGNSALTYSGAILFGNDASRLSSVFINEAVTDITGATITTSTRYFYTTISKNNQFSDTQSGRRQFFRLGVGTSPASPLDYCLTEEVDGININDSSYMECISADYTIKDSYEEVSSEYVAVEGGYGEPYATFRNNSEAPITVSEFGLFAMCSTGSSMSTAKNVLLARYLLSTPVTVAPNSTIRAAARFQFDIE